LSVQIYEPASSVIRTLERPDTPILIMIHIFHNYVRPHEGPNGKPPSEAAGINIEGEKWLTLIQNARKEKTKQMPFQRNTSRVKGS